jgi:NDP-sugar pyrophosphorylase family protein
MAGLGKRFRDAGFSCPKYEIVVKNRSLFAWSMESLRSFIDAGSDFIFVTLSADRARRFLDAETRAIGIERFKIVELDAVTDGQATTAMAAGPCFTDRQVPIVVYNIDTYVNPVDLPVAAIRGVGWIPCFAGEGSAWSFARADANGRVLEVREKQRISSWATVGLYWFSSFELFSRTYEKHYLVNSLIEAGERYVAPIYNTLIVEGHPVYMHKVGATSVIPLGTPLDVQRFVQASRENR